MHFVSVGLLLSIVLRCFLYEHARTHICDSDKGESFVSWEYCCLSIVRSALITSGWIFFCSALCNSVPPCVCVFLNSWRIASAIPLTPEWACKRETGGKGEDRRGWKEKHNTDWFQIINEMIREWVNEEWWSLWEKGLRKAEFRYEKFEDYRKRIDDKTHKIEGFIIRPINYLTKKVMRFLLVFLVLTKSHLRHSFYQIICIFFS